MRAKVLLSLLGAWLLVWLSACGQPSPSKSGGSNGKTAHVIRIGYQKNGPLIMLKELGTLEKRLEPLGYRVEWSEFQAGPALLEALNAGSIDFGRTGDSPPIFAQAAGSSLVYLAAGNSKARGSAILVKADSPIQTIADLKGKTVGFAKGLSSHFLLIQALAKAGLSYGEIKPAFLAPGDARVAFEQGDIDAWVVWDPFAADAERSGGARVLTNGEGLTSDRDFFLASASFAREHEALLKVVLEEVQKACDWVNTHHDEAAAMLTEILGIDQEAVRMALERRVYGIGPMTDEIINEQQQIAATFYELGIVPTKVNIQENIFVWSENVFTWN